MGMLIISTRFGYICAQFNYFFAEINKKIGPTECQLGDSPSCQNHALYNRVKSLI